MDENKAEQAVRELLARLWELERDPKIPPSRDEMHNLLVHATAGLDYLVNPVRVGANTAINQIDGRLTGFKDAVELLWEVGQGAWRQGAGGEADQYRTAAKLLTALSERYEKPLKEGRDRAIAAMRRARED